MRRAPLKRGQGLRPNPEKVRAWLQQTRKPLRRSEGKRRRPVPDAALVEIQRVSRGRCIRCGGPCDPRRDRHHVLPVRSWPRYEHTAHNQVLACLGCHMNHENASPRFTLSELPDEVRRWVAAEMLEHGDVYAYVRRTYPPGPARTDQSTEVQDERVKRRRDAPW